MSAPSATSVSRNSRRPRGLTLSSARAPPQAQGIVAVLHVCACQVERRLRQVHDRRGHSRRPAESGWSTCSQAHMPSGRFASRLASHRHVSLRLFRWASRHLSRAGAQASQSYMTSSPGNLLHSSAVLLRSLQCCQEILGCPRSPESFRST